MDAEQFATRITLALGAAMGAGLSKKPHVVDVQRLSDPDGQVAKHRYELEDGHVFYVLVTQVG